MSDLKFFRNDEVVCPYCEYEFSDSWEFAQHSTDNQEVECPTCYHEFNLYCDVEVKYTTSEKKVTPTTESGK